MIVFSSSVDILRFNEQRHHENNVSASAKVIEILVIIKT